MYEIVSALKQSAIVLDVEVLEVIDEDSVKLIKIKTVLKEDCFLFITELHTRDYQKYSYHCQKNDGDLIVRWDNTRPLNFTLQKTCRIAISVGCNSNSFEMGSLSKVSTNLIGRI